MSADAKKPFYSLSPLSVFPLQGLHIALILNCSISLSTGCLLVLIIAFHYKDIRVSLPFPFFVSDSLDTWVHCWSTGFRPTIFCAVLLLHLFQISVARMILCERYLRAIVWERSSRSTDGSLNTDYLCYICCVHKKTLDENLKPHWHAAAIFFQSTLLAVFV